MDNLHIPITGDNKGFVNALNDARDKVRSTAKDIEQSGMSIEQMFNKIKLAAAGAFMGLSVKGLISDIIRVRGEFQRADTAIQTMLGSKEKADELLSKVREYAKISPLEFGDITRATQMMIGFNIEADKVPGFIKAIGDVSMGESGKFNSLTLAFSQMSATGKLMGQDLNQMINAGFNPLSVMAEKTGKSMAELKEQMSKGAITAQMVQQAFIDATSEGGKFFNMSEEAAKTIGGQISMLNDAMDNMYNELGKKGEKVIVDSIGMITSLVENYKEVGSVIADIVVAYGSYKAALLIMTGIEKAHVYWKGLEAAASALNAQANIAETGSVTVLGVAKMRLTNITKSLTASMLANPYVAIGAAIAALTVAIYKAATATDEFDKAQDRLNEQTTQNEAEVLKEINRLEELNRKLLESEKGSDDYKKVKQAIIDQYGQYFSGLDAEIEKVGNLSGVYDQLTEAIRRSIGARNLKSFYDAEMDNYDKVVSGKLDKAFKALKDKYGEAEGSRLYHNLYSETILGKKGSLSVDDIGKLQKTTFYDVRWGKNAKDGLVDIRASIDDLREDIYDTKAASDKALKDYKEMYEITEEQWNEVLNPTSTAPPTNPTATPKGGKGGKETNNEATLRQKQFELRMKQIEEQEKQRRDTLAAVNKAAIASIKNDSERERAEQKEQHRLALQDIDVREEEMKKRLYEYNKSVWEANNKDSKLKYSDTEEGAAGWHGLKLTVDQKKQLESERAAENANYARNLEKRIKDEKKANQQAIDDYLRQYGDYHQKREAIFSQSNREILELEEELGKTSDELARKAIQARIDARKAQTKEEVNALEEQYGIVTQAMADLFADASKKSVKAIQDIINKYEQLIEYLEGHKGSASKDELMSLGLSEKEINMVLKGEISIKELTDRLKEMKGVLADRSPYKSFETNMKNAIEMFKKAENAADLGNALSYTASQIQAFLPSVKEFGQEIYNIFGVDDSKITAAIDGLDGLMTAGQGVGQIMQGDIGGVMNAVKGISQMVDALDGAFGADYSQYNKMVDQYENLIDVWDDLIDRKKEYISISYGMEADKAGKEAIDIANKEIEAYKELGKARLNAGASKGSSSIGRRITKNMSGDDWKDIAEALGLSVNETKNKLGSTRLTGLFDLTAEELKSIQENAYTFWATLDEDVQKYLQGIIDGEKKIQDLEKQTTEQILQTSVDDVFDDFMSALYDLADDSEDVFDDVAKNWEEMMNKMALNNLVGAKYKQELEKWYEQWNEAYRGDGTIDKEEINALRTSYNDLIHQAADEVKALREQGIVTSPSSVYKQEASSGGWQSMGQETADELNGRFTALQISGEKISEGVTTMLATLDSLSSLADDRNITLVEIRNLMITNNAFLEDILTVSKNIYKNFGKKLDEIAK